jgi:insertion element IS1 protein InsB
VFQNVTQMECNYCNGKCIKKDKVKNTQKYKCKSCLKYQQLFYKYESYKITDQQIIVLTKEGCGIRSTSRILSIAPKTVIERLKRIGNSLKRKSSIEIGKEYEVDELFTFIGNKENRVCIAYSFEPATKEVIDVVVGRRNKGNLNKVISTLILSNAKRITTDKLDIYRSIIPKEIHCTKFRGINRIERNNLSLRTHLKRLNRRSICFSRSLIVLIAVVKIYFWG